MDTRKTLLRAPGMGSYTPPHALVTSNPCPNCGTNVQLEYCPECGQRHLDRDQSLRELLREASRQLLQRDGVYRATLRVLVASPGVLTREYLAGRRVRYLSPLRLALLCGAVYAAAAAIVPGPTRPDSPRSLPASAAPLPLLAGEPSARRAVPAPAVQPPARRFEAAPMVGRARSTLATPAASLVLLGLVPFLAALLGVVYRDRHRPYPQHLAYALHVQAMLFLALVPLLGQTLLPHALRAAYALALLVPFAVWLTRATRVVYGGSTRQSLGRLAVVGALHAAALLAALALAFR